MPRLIKDGAIVEDAWLPVDPEGEPGDNRIHTLAQWQANPSANAVQLEPGDEPWPLLEALGSLELIAVNFPVFTDGRGFSYARELREKGYTGELRATGHFQRDQMTYLRRVGCNAFALDDDSKLEAALASLQDFSEHYQASIEPELPLFRRR